MEAVMRVLSSSPRLMFQTESLSSSPRLMFQTEVLRLFLEDFTLKQVAVWYLSGTLLNWIDLSHFKKIKKKFCDISTIYHQFFSIFSYNLKYWYFKSLKQIFPQAKIFR